MSPDRTSEPDPDGSPALVLDGSTSAVQMSAELGAEVDRILSIHLLAGAVIKNGADWVFLTQSARAPYRLPDDMAARDVTTLHAGNQVPLPAPSASDDAVRWVHEPGDGQQNPPIAAVVCATRRALLARSAQVLASA